MKNIKLDIDSYLKDLEEIVNIDSGSKDKEGVTKVAKVLESKFKEKGLYTKLLNENKDVGFFLEVKNTDKDKFDFLLVGHIDTVFSKGEVDKRPFTTKDNIAKGPGVADMKAGVLLGYYVISEIEEIFKDKKNKPKIAMAINSDEEIGSKESRPWLKEMAKKSKYVLVLEPADEGGAILNQRRGIAAYDIEFKGVAAHAGIEPEKGRSAIEELGNWIVKLHSLNNLDKGTTVNVGVVSGGTVSNVVAEHAKARVDVRFQHDSERKRIEKAMDKMIKKPTVEGVKVSYNRGIRPPMNPTKETDKLCKIIKKIGKDINMDIKFDFNGAGSDANIIAELSIPVLDGLGPVGGGFHGEDEYMKIDSIEPRFKLLVNLLSNKY